MSILVLSFYSSTTLLGGNCLNISPSVPQLLLKTISSTVALFTGIVCNRMLSTLLLLIVFNSFQPLILNRFSLFIFLSYINSLVLVLRKQLFYSNYPASHQRTPCSYHLLSLIVFFTIVCAVFLNVLNKYLCKIKLLMVNYSIAH